MRIKKILLTIMICFLCYTPTFAIEPVTSQNFQLQDNDAPLARAEQVRWYLRTRNGINQKRLWSITYGYWKTNWINC